MSGLSETASEVDAPETIEEVIARKIGEFDVIRSSNRVLLLDLDSAAQIKTYRRVYDILAPVFYFGQVEEWESKTPGHLHVRIHLNVGMTAKSRYAIQAVLGSDPVREALSLARLVKGESEPNILFRPKVQRLTIPQ